MANININAFSAEFQSIPNFSNLVEFFGSSPALVDMVNAMPSGAIRLGLPDGGSFELTVDGKPTVTLDPNIVPGSATGVEQNFGTFATSLAHELGHAIDSNVANANDASSPDAAVAIGLGFEGFALTKEFVVADELALRESDRIF